MQLSVTFASFLIAISFMIGTAARNLMTAVLFIFITRLYDVGDRVHIYNDVQTRTKPTDVTVVKVNLLTTVFKRWDEQVGGVDDGVCAVGFFVARRGGLRHPSFILSTVRNSDLSPTSHPRSPLLSNYLGASLVAETLRRVC